MDDIDFVMTWVDGGDEDGEDKLKLLERWN